MILENPVTEKIKYMIKNSYHCRSFFKFQCQSTRIETAKKEGSAHVENQ